MSAPTLTQSDNDKPDFVQNNTIYNRLDFVFDQCPLNIALQDIASRAAVNIIWSDDIKDLNVSGRYIQAPVNEMLQSIADSAGLNFYQTGSIFCMSKNDNEVKYYGIVKTVLTKDQTALQDVDQTHYGSITLLAGKRRDVTNSILALSQIQEDITRAYNAELYIVKVNKDLMAKLQAEIKSLGYNLASGVPSIDQILSITSDWGLDKQDLQIVQKPILYLSDGAIATFSVGSTRTLERKTASEYGYISTAGYDEKSDGFRLELQASYLKEDIINLSIKLRQSMYRERVTSDKEALPISDTSEVVSPSLYCKFGRWYLIASLDDKRQDNNYNFIGFNNSKKEFVFLVFCKISNVNFNSSNYSY